MENFIEEYSKWLDDSKKHLSNQVLANYANLGELLSEKENRFVENHLKKCPECEERYNRLVIEDKEMDVAIAEEESSETKPENPEKIFNLQKVFKYSVAAIIVVGLILATYFSFFQEEKNALTEKKKPEAKTDTIKQIPKNVSDSIEVVQEAGRKKEEIIDQNAQLKSFATNETLENFIFRNVRSESNIDLLQPGEGDTIVFPFTFKWNQKSVSGSNRLIIVDNQNDPLYQVEIGGKEITIDQKLTNGLYYWKLETDGKLVAVGKFYIVKESVIPDKNKRSPF